MLPAPSALEVAGMALGVLDKSTQPGSAEAMFKVSD
jgi:hypothetical protein